MGSMIGALRSFGQDSSVLKRKIKRGTAKRTLSFASAHAWLLGVLVVIGSASIGVANSLIYRQIIVSAHVSSYQSCFACGVLFQQPASVL